MLKIPRDDVVRVLKATREVERRIRSQPVKRARWQGSKTPMELMPLILYDDVAPGDTNKYAWQTKVEGGSIVANESADKVYVQNVFPGTFRGVGSNHSADWDTDTASMIWTARGKDDKEHIVCGVERAKRCSAILTADAGPGASVNVDNVVPLDGGLSPLSDPDSTSETISATMPAAARALDNATCVIEWDEHNDAWKIHRVHEQARMIRGTLSADLDTTDTSITISNPTSMDGGQVPTGTLTGYNVFDWEGDSGGVVILVWNETTDHYEMVQVECPA